jgi:hypothetical protein
LLASSAVTGYSPNNNGWKMKEDFFEDIRKAFGTKERSAIQRANAPRSFDGSFL